MRLSLRSNGNRLSIQLDLWAAAISSRMQHDAVDQTANLFQNRRTLAVSPECLM
jgi:hypothetical protein